MTKGTREKGQAAVEFALIAPLLLLTFFCIIQLAYAAYAALAVQRAALSVARAASLGGTDNMNAARIQVAAALLPIARLNRGALLTILETRCQAEVSPDNSWITARVSYPMPLWVPLAGKIFGKPLTPSFHDREGTEKLAIDSILLLLNRPGSDLSFKGVRLPVLWITREATTFNEAYAIENK